MRSSLVSNFECPERPDYIHIVDALRTSNSIFFVYFNFLVKWSVDYWLWFVCVRPKVERHNKCQLGVSALRPLPDLCTIFRNYILHTFTFSICFVSLFLSLWCAIGTQISRELNFPCHKWKTNHPRKHCVRWRRTSHTNLWRAFVWKCKRKTTISTTTRKSQTAVGFSVLPSSRPTHTKLFRSNSKWKVFGFILFLLVLYSSVRELGGWLCALRSYFLWFCIELSERVSKYFRSLRLNGCTMYVSAHVNKSPANQQPTIKKQGEKAKPSASECKNLFYKSFGEYSQLWSS